jgi:hypothetical protein
MEGHCALLSNKAKDLLNVTVTLGWLKLPPDASAAFWRKGGPNRALVEAMHHDAGHLTLTRLQGEPTADERLRTKGSNPRSTYAEPLSR